MVDTEGKQDLFPFPAGPHYTSDKMQNACSRFHGIVFLEQWPLQPHLRAVLGFL